MTYMDYVDILFPLAMGLLLLAGASLLVKSSGNVVADYVSRKRIRVIGIILLALAVLHIFVKYFLHG